GYISDYYEKYPGLKDRVTFVGAISDKSKLKEEYLKSKVFTLPSLSESFGIVLVEAASNGCYLITSDMVPACYDISHRFENGMAVSAGNAEALAEAFHKICDGETDWKSIEIKTAAYVKAAYDWSKIVNKLYAEICETI
ncbi:MAG: glycosyltransferase, partial [Lachnospiraceae bacterium]|nr:glycosyltransferase [Lachnospiraceae bacterium]